MDYDLNKLFNWNKTHDLQNFAHLVFHNACDIQSLDYMAIAADYFKDYKFNFFDKVYEEKLDEFVDKLVLVNTPNANTLFNQIINQRVQAYQYDDFDDESNLVVKNYIKSKCFAYVNSSYLGSVASNQARRVNFPDFDKEVKALNDAQSYREFFTKNNIKTVDEKIVPIDFLHNVFVEFFVKHPTEFEEFRVSKKLLPEILIFNTLKIENLETYGPKHFEILQSRKKNSFFKEFISSLFMQIDNLKKPQALEVVKNILKNEGWSEFLENTKGKTLQEHLKVWDKKYHTTEFGQVMVLMRRDYLDKTLAPKTLTLPVKI